MNSAGTEGWAVGSSRLILHYADGRWHSDSIAGAGPSSWTGIAFAGSSDLGFAVGARGWIARYRGNHHWAAQQEGARTDALTSVWVDGPGQEAFAVGKGGTVLRWQPDAWQRVALERISNTTTLDDVAGTDEQLWVRGQARLFVFSRRQLQWIHNVGNFDASDLWVQPPGERVWIAGVGLPGGRIPRDGSYTIRAYGPAAFDSTVVPNLLPIASWMGTGGCGLVSGPDYQSGMPIGFSGYVVDGRNYMFRNPSSTQFTAVWTNKGCSDGWAIGPDGFVARLRRMSLGLSGIREGRGPALTYTLALDSAVTSPVFSRMRMLLIRDGDTVALVPNRHFSVDSLAPDSLRLQVKDSAHTEAAQFKGQAVKLQIELPYAVSEPIYPVLYESSSPMVFTKMVWWKKRPWLAIIFAVAFTVIVMYVLFRPRSRKS